MDVYLCYIKNVKIDSFFYKKINPYILWWTHLETIYKKKFMLYNKSSKNNKNNSKKSLETVYKVPFLCYIKNVKNRQ